MKKKIQTPTLPVGTSTSTSTTSSSNTTPSPTTTTTTALDGPREPNAVVTTNDSAPPPKPPVAGASPLKKVMKSPVVGGNTTEATAATTTTTTTTTTTIHAQQSGMPQPIPGTTTTTTLVRSTADTPTTATRSSSTIGKKQLKSTIRMQQQQQQQQDDNNNTRTATMPTNTTAAAVSALGKKQVMGSSQRNVNTTTTTTTNNNNTEGDWNNAAPAPPVAPSEKRVSVTSHDTLKVDVSESNNNDEPSKELWNNDPSKDFNKDVSEETVPPPLQRETPVNRRQAQPGAYAMNVAAPIYIMEGDDDDGEFEPIPEELLSPHHRRTNNAATAAAAAPPVPEEPVVLDAEVSAVKLVTHNDDGDENKYKQQQQEGAGFCTKKRLVVGGVLILVLVVVVVVIALVAGGGGGGGGDDGDETRAATLAPTLSPTRDPDFCVANLQKDFIPGFLNRASLGDFSKVFDVEICPGSEIQVIEAVSFSDPWFGVNPPLIAQSNMHVKCGKEGKLTDKCILHSGSALMLNVYRNSGIGEKRVQNVLVEGLVFERGSYNLLDLRGAGDITYRNCIFRDSPGGIPIAVNFQVDGSVLDKSANQTVRFESCIFEDLVYSELENGVGGTKFANPLEEASAIIWAGDESNIVIVRDCVFRKNKVQGALPGTVIASSGAKVIIENTCFLTNEPGQGRYSSPILLGGDTSSMTSFQSGKGNYVEGAWNCPWISHLQEDGAITCGATDDSPASSCQSSMFDFDVNW